MMSMREFLSDESTLTVIGGLLGMIWSVFRGTDLYSRFARGRYEKALRCLEAGVGATYETYVREIKLYAADGKLTVVERQRARELARKAAIRIGLDQGVNVVRELGEGLVDEAIERSVRGARRAAMKPVSISDWLTGKLSDARTPGEVG